jgi:hypothetical protein
MLFKEEKKKFIFHFKEHYKNLNLQIKVEF